MAEARTAIANKPVWVDLATSDPAASREFYSKLFGWMVEVNPDPQYGGYGMARTGGKDIAGIGPKMDPKMPTAWSFYLGAQDAGALAKKVEQAGGNVISPAFDVGDQGRMAVFQDPVGAFICVWEPKRMGAFDTEGPGRFAWAELNARGFEKAIPFYKSVFGWSAKKSEMSGGGPYTEFQIGGTSIAGGMEMPSQVPAGTPNHWLVYFGVDDVDKASRKAVDGGGTELMAPMDFPGGRFSVLQDPQGATFGLLNMKRS
jgi:predicted enzyme related to lactoylglutathione lyase